MISVYASIECVVKGSQGLQIQVSTLERCTLYLLLELSNPVLNGRTTCMLSSVHDVAELLTFCAEHDHCVSSARILTPGDMNHTGVWTLEELGAIFEAEEPESPRYKAMVYETASGRYYTCSEFGTSLEALGRLACLIEFSVEPVTRRGRDSRVLKMPSVNRAGVVPIGEVSESVD